MAYTKAVWAAVLPWNQRRERRAAASTSELGRPAACLNVNQDRLARRSRSSASRSELAVSIARSSWGSNRIPSFYSRSLAESVRMSGMAWRLRLQYLDAIYHVMHAGTAVSSSYAMMSTVIGAKILRAGTPEWVRFPPPVPKLAAIHP